GLGPAADPEDQEDKSRALGGQSRQLVENFQRSREGMLSSPSNRAAVLDAPCLVWLSELGKEKANQMFSKSLDLAPFLELLSSLRLSLSPDDDLWSNTGQACVDLVKSQHCTKSWVHSRQSLLCQSINLNVSKKQCKFEESRAMPTYLENVEEDDQEGTEEEVERIWEIFFFSHCGNIHISFNKRDGLARMRLDKNKLPVIEPLNEESE
ncbi:hypothetical protein HPG69_007160, partial [Diceros bicornis minor]